MNAKTVGPLTSALGIIALVLFAGGCYLFVIWNGCGGASSAGDFVEQVRAFHTASGCVVG